MVILGIIRNAQMYCWGQNTRKSFRVMKPVVRIPCS